MPQTRPKRDGVPVIDFQDVTKQYANGTKALDHISLHIDKGEFVFVVGASGAGKSTLIKLILREEKPTEGTVMVNGLNLNKIRRRQIPRYRRSLGVVFQDFRLIPNMTVYDNVAFSLRVTGVSNREIRRKVPYMLSLVDLASKARYMPEQLSGGEQQRVALARALVNNPQLIIADEPTGNIDPELSYEVVDLFTQINKCGTTILMVTHEHDMVKYFGGRTIEIEGGRIVFVRVLKGERDLLRERAALKEKKRKEQQAHELDKTREIGHIEPKPEQEVGKI